MKKILSFLVLGFLAVAPFTVSAASSIVTPIACTPADESGSRTCTVEYMIDEATPQDSVTVKLTEYGGANITAINDVTGSEFMVGNKDEVDGVHTVGVVSLQKITGTVALFTFTYVESGTTDCKVKVSIGDDNKEVTSPTNPTDTPTDNVETGSSLPYIALGAIALIAVIGYVATKNKTKMYRI